MEYTFNLKKFMVVKGSNSLTHFQRLLFRVKDTQRGWIGRYSNNAVSQGEWEEALASLAKNKTGIGLLTTAASDLRTTVEVHQVDLGTGHTLEKFFRHKRKRDLTTQQALLFGIRKSRKGWKKQNKHKEVSEAIWKLLIETCYEEKKEGTSSENQKLYLMRNQIGMYKVGISGDPFARANTLANASGIDVKVVAVWDTGAVCARSVELDMHKRFKTMRMRGEWFDLGEDGFRRVHSSLKESGRFEVDLIYSYEK